MRSTYLVFQMASLREVLGACRPKGQISSSLLLGRTLHVGIMLRRDVLSPCGELLGVRPTILSNVCEWRIGKRPACSPTTRESSKSDGTLQAARQEQ